MNKEFDERLRDQARNRWENYLCRRIDLSTAREKELKCLAGEFIYVPRASSKSAAAKIILNRDSNEELDLNENTKIQTLFIQFYITNEAQAGEWIDLITGTNFDYDSNIQDAESQPCIILTNALADTNTVAAANPCNRVLVRAHTGNAGTVWIDFGTPAVAGACYELTAGDAISVPCSNTNRINGLFTAGGDDATIVYEV